MNIFFRYFEEPDFSMYEKKATANFLILYWFFEKRIFPPKKGYKVFYNMWWWKSTRKSKDLYNFLKVFFLKKNEMKNFERKIAFCKFLFFEF